MQIFDATRRRVYACRPVPARARAHRQTHSLINSRLRMHYAAAAAAALPSQRDAKIIPAAAERFMVASSRRLEHIGTKSVTVKTRRRCCFTRPLVLLVSAAAYCCLVRITLRRDSGGHSGCPSPPGRNHDLRRPGLLRLPGRTAQCTPGTTLADQGLPPLPSPANLQTGLKFRPGGAGPSRSRAAPGPGYTAGRGELTRRSLLTPCTGF